MYYSQISSTSLQILQASQASQALQPLQPSRKMSEILEASSEDNNEYVRLDQAWPSNDLDMNC